MLSERLRRLDNRVLGMDERMATLGTVDGWRRYAARWRWMTALATSMLAVPFIVGVFGYDSLFGFIAMGGVLAFQAGKMKAEDDRLNRRGPLERLRPPGL
jgi:hypothetical protein